MWLTDLGTVHTLAVAIVCVAVSPTTPPSSSHKAPTQRASAKASGIYEASSVPVRACPQQRSAPLVWLGWQGQPGGPAQPALANERGEVEKIQVNALASASRWNAVVHFLPTRCWVSSRPFAPAKLITLCTACKCFEIVNDMFLNNCEHFRGYIRKIFHRWFGG